MIFAVPMVVIMHILLYFLMILLHKSKIVKIEGVADYIKVKKKTLDL